MRGLRQGRAAAAALGMIASIGAAAPPPGGAVPSGRTAVGDAESAGDEESRAEEGFRRLAERLSSEPVHKGYSLEFFRPPVLWSELQSLASGVDRRSEAWKSICAAYVDYLKRVERPLLQDYPAARVRISEITDAVMAGEPLAVVEAASELPRQVDRASEAIQSAEDELWQRVSPLIPPENAWLWERVQYRLALEQAATRPGDVPGCLANLSALLEGGGSGRADLGAAAPQVREVEIGAWRRARTLLRDRTKAARKAGGEWLVFRSRGAAGKWAPVRAALAVYVDAESRLLEHNREVCARLATLLGPEEGPALLNRFRAVAFPCVYPDPTCLDGFTAVIRPLVDGRPEREAVLRVLEEAGAQRQELCTRMEAAFVEWRDASERRLDPPASPQEYSERMGALALQRIAVATKALESVRSITAGSDAHGEVAPLIDAAIDEVATRSSRFKPDPRISIVLRLRPGHAPELEPPPGPNRRRTPEGFMMQEKP